MTPETYERMHALREQLSGLAGEHRRAFLDRHCAGDPRLRAALVRLVALAGRTRPPSPLDGPPLVSLLPRPAPPDPMLGRRLGDYELRQLLAAEGTANVYLAVRRAGLGQCVAVKVIRRGLAGGKALHRFRAEQRVVAGLRHPHVARLLGAGMTGGCASLVREHVEGQPIDRHCDAHGLSVRARLELFVQVCAAVQFAHEAGVIHRDLAPGNVLVAADGSPRLVGFGVAGLLRSQRGSAPTLPQHRALTPDCASPEQLRGGPPRATDDVYALGVLLYELLAGRRPHRVAWLPFDEAARRLCARGPERPSVAAGKRFPGPSLATPEEVARARASSVAGLRRRLAGDLDEVVLMALRADPDRRYRSAEQLADDVRRHLDDLPVRARPGNLLYRAGRFVRRNRRAVAAVVLAAGLLAGLAGTAWGVLQGQEARVAGRPGCFFEKR